MRILWIVVCCLVGSMVPALAEPCPGNPDALGTSRTLTVDAKTFPRIGTMQYRASLPLNDHEVVITFDDGPLPPYSDYVLRALAKECVKATYFLVGTMARANPEIVRRIYNAGHTIGTHSQHHPFGLGELGLKRISSEVDGGIASVQKAVGDARAVAPFFRIPGLARSRQAEGYLSARQLSVWSADEVADDWHRGITSAQIVRKAMSRLEAKGRRGVLLLHDIKPATARAVPQLLKELKAGGYRIVHAVPAAPRPETVPELPTTMVAENTGWPRVAPQKTETTGSIKTRRPRHVKVAALLDKKKAQDPDRRVRFRQLLDVSLRLAPAIVRRRKPVQHLQHRTIFEPSGRVRSQDGQVAHYRRIFRVRCPVRDRAGAEDLRHLQEAPAL
jgi:peptidoglycan/xylan/chitin deacetylase (PgdA/CDA1 family)